VADLESGRSEPLAPGFRALSYDISPDGREVVMETADNEGKPRLWITPLDRSSSPRQVPNVEGGSPRFGPDGTILFRHMEASRMEHTSGYIYSVKPDGTGIRKASDRPVFIVGGISPDRQWFGAWGPLNATGPPASQLFALDGRPPIVVGTSMAWMWSPDGARIALWAELGEPIPVGRSYLVPLQQGQPMPKVPEGGYTSEEQVAHLPGAQRIDTRSLAPGPLPGQYAFYRGTVLRNLYRIPIR
jgi:hypothetical protein